LRKILFGEVKNYQFFLLTFLSPSFLLHLRWLEIETLNAKLIEKYCTKILFLYRPFPQKCPLNVGKLRKGAKIFCPLPFASPTLKKININFRMDSFFQDFLFSLKEQQEQRRWLRREQQAMDGRQ